ncbi:MAG: CehA/McbA family metallohydrolase [Acidimicrobiia bacterium]
MSSVPSGTETEQGSKGGSTVWLKGDFHAHSSLSDGVLAPRRFIEEAEREALDFFAITDHNTWSYPDFSDSDQVLVIAGIEVTMPYGHFNVFSVDGIEPDWVPALPPPAFVERSETQKGQALDLIETIRRSGLRSSINHPLLFPWEWTDTAAPLAGFQYLEVWNDPTWPENRLANPAALDMWTQWLNAGLAVTAVGGSDFHDPEKYLRGDGFTVDGHRVGVPRSYVDAAACTPQAILDAVDRGRVYVTMGPTIEFAVESEHGTVSMGDRIEDFDGPFWIAARTWGDAELEIQVVTDGVTVARSAGTNPVIEHRIDPEPNARSWVRIDVVGPDGVVAFTNPVHFGRDPERSDFDYGSFTDLSAAFGIQERWQTQQTTDQEEQPW